MSTSYVVKSGDSLSKIAAAFGIPSWRDIYDFPENAAFRLKRPNPNLIFPGDSLFIPTKAPGPPLPTPPAPPGPTPPPNPTPPLRGTLTERLSAYLAREARRNVAEIILKHDSRMIVFGEVHFAGDALKAFFLSELARQVRLQRPMLTHFHASERFFNTDATRRQISRFLQAKPEAMGIAMLGLSPELTTFLPLLAQANSFPNRRYGVLPTDKESGGVPQTEDFRHEALFEGFNASATLCPDVPRGSINPSVGRGSFLLGARHAARRHVAGRPSATTCARLEKAGWSVHAVRLTVRDVGGVFVPDDWNLKPRILADTSTIKGLDILESIAAGRSFYADLTKPDSPFNEVKDADRGAADIPYNTLYDAVLHLSADTVPFPVAGLVKRRGAFG